MTHLLPGRKYVTQLQFEVPAHVSNSEVRDFILDWLSQGGGYRHPHDPLFASLQDVRIVGKIAEKKS